MATYTGKKIKDTYRSILKLEDNENLTSSTKRVTDALGNITPLSISSAEVKANSLIEANGFKTPTGTANDYLMADGSTSTGGGGGLTEEEVRDVAAAQWVDGTNTTVVYDDAGNTLKINSTDTDTQRTDEEVRDIIGATIVDGTNTTVVVDDAANTIKINSTDTNTQRTDAEINALVGNYTDAKYLRSDADDTTTGKLSASGLALSKQSSAVTSNELLFESQATGSSNVSEGHIYTYSGIDYNVGMIFGTQAKDDSGDEFIRPSFRINDTDNDVTFYNGIEVTDGVKIVSGLSTEFLKADGTLDSSTYLTSYTDTQRSDEEIMDVIGDMVVDGTNTTVVYDDAGNTLKINSTDTNTQLSEAEIQAMGFIQTDTNTQRSDEEIMDVMGAAWIDGTNTTVVYDDVNNTLKINSVDTNTDTNTQRSDEEIRDVAAAQWTDGTNTTVVYDDAANTLKINSVNTDTNTQRTDAEINTLIGNYTDAKYLRSNADDTTTGSLTVQGNTKSKDLILTNNASNQSLLEFNVNVGGGANTTKAHIYAYSGTDYDAALLFGTQSKSDSGNEFILPSFRINDSDNDVYFYHGIEVVDSIKLSGGLSTQFLKADGSVDTNTYLTSYTDTNTQLSTEQVQDIVGAMVSSNTETNIAVTYNDSAGKLNFASVNTNTQLSQAQVGTYATNEGFIKSYVNTQRTDEQIRDVASAQWVNGTNTTVVKDDGANTIKINSVNTDTNTTYTAGNGLELDGTTFQINGGVIPGSANLNDYDESGYYTQNSNSNATSGSNYPESKAGVLTVVVADDNTVHKTQTYDIYNSSAFYNRSYYNGTWSSWRNLAQDTNTNTQRSDSEINNLIGNYTDAKYLRSNTSDTMTGSLTIDGGINVNNNGDGLFNVNESNGAFQLGDIDSLNDTCYIEGDGSNFTIYNDGNATLTTNVQGRVGMGDGTNGYFYSDTDGRTAYNGGDLYIQTGVNRYYNYATYQYHGNSSGDQHYFRGNSLSGNDWSISTAGLVSASKFYVPTATATSQWVFHGRNSANTADSGIYFDSGSGEVLLRNSSNSLTGRLRSSGNSYFNGGSLGVGTDNPSAKLHVLGDSNNVALRVTRGDNTSQYLDFRGYQIASNGNNLLLSADNAKQVWLGHQSSASEMVIDVGGNAGIGTTSPNARLDVSGAGNFSGGTVVSGIDTSTSVGVAIAKGDYLYSNDGNYLRKIIGQQSGGSIDIGQQGTSLISNINFFPGSSGNIDFFGSGSIDMRVASSGNVGIGTTSPDSKLEVASSDSNTYVHVRNDGTGSSRFKMSNNSDSNSSGFQIINNASNGQVNLLNYKNSDLALWANSSQKLTIKPNGRIGVSTNNPQAMLHVDNPQTSTGSIGILLDPAASGYSTIGMKVSIANYGEGMRFVRSGTYSGNALKFFNNTSQVGGVFINQFSTSFNTTSDYRVKENIVPIENSINRLNKLKPCRFNFLTDTENTFDGFIAHEAQEVVPESVTGEKDKLDFEGNPEYQSIDHSKLVPLLTSALQEAISKIDQLEIRIQNLEKLIS